MIDLIIDLPEECKTADEIMGEIGRIRYDLHTADVFEHGRFTIRMSAEQFDEGRNIVFNSFHVDEEPNEPQLPRILGFNIEVK